MTRPKVRRDRIAVKHPASPRLVKGEIERVMRDLEAVIRENSKQTDPIVEQLKQCPEVFKAGEMIGKMLDQLKYNQGADAAGDRYLPPPGAVIPPLV
jgi:hypothetical protein